MSSVNYYAKYLKYKKKYLDLVNETKKGGNNKEAERGMECGPDSICTEGEDGQKRECFFGYCEPVREDGKPLAEPLTKTIGKQIEKDQRKTPAQLKKEQDKEKVNAAKAVAAANPPDTAATNTQKGGENELNINELLSESSFN